MRVPSAAMRHFVIGLAAALVLAAGCGGGTESATGAESAATIAPATAALYASINSDLDSEQWNELEALLDKFPDGDRLVTEIRESFADEDIDVERDLKPAVGPTLEIVVPSFANDAADNVVGLMKPKDEDKFRALLQKSDDPPVTREIEGWTAFADSEEALDRFEQALGDESLEDSDRFQDAMAKLPEDALAKLYVDGTQATDALENLPGAGSAPTTFGRTVYVAAAMEAESNGLRVLAAARTEDSTLEVPDLTLLEEVPGETIAFLNFHGFSGQLGLTKQLRETPAIAQALQQVEQTLGVTLDDLTTLFNEEGVLYVRRGALIPEVTLLLEVEDRARALRTLDSLAERATSLGAQPPRERSIGDVQAKQLDFGQFSIFYGGWDNRLVVTSAEAGIRALRAGGDKVVDEASYKQSLEAGGVGDEEEVIIWVDLQQAGDLIAQLSDLSGEDVPPEVAANLRPLRSFVAAGTWADDDSTFRFFLEVE